ncbi:MAG: PrsW family intramembrane metalloprotease [Anaerolineales bacterium]|nr:PrsW family intramembrane metalloprotease [Anaerolineales bacterium]
MSETVLAENPTPAPASKTTRFHWPSAIQLGLSILAALLLWSYALFTLLAEVIRITGQTNAGSDFGQIANDASSFVRPVGIIFAGILLIPSAFFSLARLLDWQIAGPAWLKKAGQTFQATSILLAAVAVAIGFFVSQHELLATIFLPLLHILAASLPIVWLVWLAYRKQPKPSPQRFWGIFGSGLVLGPGLILIAELTALLLIVVLSVLYITLQPGLAEEINQLGLLLENTQNPDRILSLLLPHMLSPGAILGMLGFIAVIVPLIEELIKPIGVWLLAGRKLTPQAGFVAGLISGAGYALFENLTLATTGGDQWALVISIRAITSLIHIFTTGLTGWALATAWQKRIYFKLGLAYLAAVIIHGLWNGLLVLAGFTILPIVFDYESVLPPYMLGISGITLAVLALGLFAMIAFSGRIVRPALSDLPTVSPETAKQASS